MSIGIAAPQSLALGQLGTQFIQSADGAQLGTWGRIYCVSACAFTVLTSSTFVVQSGTLSDFTMGAGMEIQGYFTAITLASGSVIAYTC